MSPLILVLFLLGLLTAGVLGTETRLLFFWPAAVLIGLSGLLAAVKWRLRAFFPPSDVCLLTVVLLGAYLAARALGSPVQYYAREDLFLLAAAFVVYLLMLTEASHPRWRLAILGTLLALVVANLAVGYIHLSGQWQFHVVPNFIRGAPPGRIGGFFANPNHLAAFLSFALFLSAGWLVFGRGGAVLKLWLGFMSVAMAIGMALTVSRGALLGLGAGVLVFAALALWVVWQTQRHLFWALLGGGVILGLLGGAVLWKVNDEYLRGRMERSPVAGDIRLGIWEAALTQHAQSPLIGAGARMFYEGGVQYRSAKLPVYAPEALFTHNEYLQMLADYGWVGLGLLGVVLVAHVWNGLAFVGWFCRHRFVQTGRVLSSQLALCLGALAAVAATLVHAVFEFHLHVAAPVLVFMVALGILANPGYESDSRAQMRLPAVRWLAKALLIPVALALLAGAWFYGRADLAVARADVAQLRKDAVGRKRFLDEAVALDPANAQAWYQRALAALEGMTAEDRAAQTAVLQQAKADLERAAELNPHNYLYPLAQADVLDALGLYDEALGRIQAALLLAPLHEEPRLALGVHWHRLGEFPKAEEAYLWARASRAWNEDDTSRWIDNYRLLLQHVPLKRPAKP